MNDCKIKLVGPPGLILEFIENVSTDSQVKPTDALNAALFCWSVGKHRMSPHYRELALEKWPWLDTCDE